MKFLKFLTFLILGFFISSESIHSAEKNVLSPLSPFAQSEEDHLFTWNETAPSVHRGGMGGGKNNRFFANRSNGRGILPHLKGNSSNQTPSRHPMAGRPWSRHPLGNRVRTNHPIDLRELKVRADAKSRAQQNTPFPLPMQTDLLASLSL